jgi:hypothetical protein
MNSPVRLWQQFWLGGDDAYENLIVAGAEGMKAISTARRERFEDNAAQACEFDSNGQPTPTFRYNLCRSWQLVFANDGQQHRKCKVHGMAPLATVRFSQRRRQRSVRAEAAGPRGGRETARLRFRPGRRQDKLCDLIVIKKSCTLCPIPKLKIGVNSVT